jgi:hypothetical protein
VGSFFRDERLLGASWEGDLDQVRNLVRFGADVNFQEDTGETQSGGLPLTGMLRLSNFLYRVAQTYHSKTTEAKPFLTITLTPTCGHY